MNHAAVVAGVWIVLVSWLTARHHAAQHHPMPKHRRAEQKHIRAGVELSIRDLQRLDDGLVGKLDLQQRQIVTVVHGHD